MTLARRDSRTDTSYSIVEIGHHEGGFWSAHHHPDLWDRKRTGEGKWRRYCPDGTSTLYGARGKLSRRRGLSSPDFRNPNRRRYDACGPCRTTLSFLLFPSCSRRTRQGRCRRRSGVLTRDYSASSCARRWFICLLLARPSHHLRDLSMRISYEGSTLDRTHAPPPSPPTVGLRAGTKES